MRKPNFDNMLKVLRKEVPSRTTLFELFMNYPLYERLTGRKLTENASEMDAMKLVIDGYAAAGYDYATTHGCESFSFGTGDRLTVSSHIKTTSLNTGFCINDRATYERFYWNDPDQFNYSRLQKARELLPEGMKLMVMGPGGVLENVISLVGYDNLCLLLYDDPELVQEIFDQVGSRLLGYYANAVQYETVGFVCSNDDWGFNTQTFLSLDDMRKYVFPWHKKIVELSHANGKPCILHSCGFFTDVMDDVIDDMKYDGKHSFEDNILPIEDSYEKWNPRIALLGGIDVDFIIKATPEQIKTRCRKMIERTAGRGGYCLGTGNSVPEYIPQENYMAMISVIDE